VVLDNIHIYDSHPDFYAVPGYSNDSSHLAVCGNRRKKEVEEVIDYLSHFRMALSETPHFLPAAQ
jgi:hypothetical protein